MKAQRGFTRRRVCFSRSSALLIFLSFYIICIAGDGGELVLRGEEGDVLVLRNVNSYTLLPTEDYLILREGSLLLWGEKSFLNGPANPLESGKRFVLCADGSALFYGGLSILPNPLYMRVDKRYKNELIFRGKLYRLSDYVKSSSLVRIKVIRDEGVEE